MSQNTFTKVKSNDQLQKNIMSFHVSKTIVEY